MKQRIIVPFGSFPSSVVPPPLSGEELPSVWGRWPSGLLEGRQREDPHPEVWSRGGGTAYVALPPIETQRLNKILQIARIKQVYTEYLLLTHSFILYLQLLLYIISF